MSCLEKPMNSLFCKTTFKISQKYYWKAQFYCSIRTTILMHFLNLFRITWHQWDQSLICLLPKPCYCYWLRVSSCDPVLAEQVLRREKPLPMDRCGSSLNRFSQNPVGCHHSTSVLICKFHKVVLKTSYFCEIPRVSQCNGMTVQGVISFITECKPCFCNMLRTQMREGEWYSTYITCILRSRCGGKIHCSSKPSSLQHLELPSQHVCRMTRHSLDLCFGF